MTRAPAEATGGADALLNPLRACARGELPPNVALAQVIAAAESPAAVEDALAVGLADVAGEGSAGARLRSSLSLWRTTPNAWNLVRGVLSQAPHDQANGCCEDWAQVFDRAARVSPEAAVAVYALGRADLMARATASIAQRLKQWGLLQPAGSVLDLGCGVGRLVHAIASEVAVVAGLDVSQEMLTAARRRCAGLPNALFLHGSGRDLSPLADSAFDLIAAVDVFPYVVSCGTEMAACHLAECHRVLKSSRSLLILNYAYGRSYSEEAEELGRLSDSTGFDLVRIGSGDFDLWDGRTFHLVRR